jgi:chromate transporter
MTERDPATDAEAIPRRRLLAAIAAVGLTSLGGWPSYYHDAFVVKRRWLTDREYLEGSAMSNLVPGPIFTNFTIFAAHRLGGWRMVPIGLVLVLVPGAAAMLLLLAFYADVISQMPVARLALRGFGAAAAALTAVTVVRLLASGSMTRTDLIIGGLAFAGLGPLDLGMGVVVPPLLLAALWVERPRRTEATPGDG